MHFIIHFFVPCLGYLFQQFSQGKVFLLSENKVSRTDANYIREIQFNRENFLIARDKIFLKGNAQDPIHQVWT